MRSLCQIILSLFLCQAILAANDDVDWTTQIDDLKEVIGASAAAGEVLADLEAWDPDQSVMGTESLYRFRDLYLNDPSYTGMIRAMVAPSFMNSLYKYWTGASMADSAEVIFRSGELSLEFLRLIHKIPYALTSNADEIVLTKDEFLKSVGVMTSHGLILINSVLLAAIPEMDPFNGLAVYLGTQLFRCTSYTLTLCAGVFNDDIEYLDVALRSLENSYIQRHKPEHLAIIMRLQAHRLQNKAKID